MADGKAALEYDGYAFNSVTLVMQYLPFGNISLAHGAQALLLFECTLFCRVCFNMSLNKIYIL
jgi:hypothetical protein